MEQPKPLLPMPIKAAPYKHQIDAFNFVCGKFGLIPASGMASSGAALLMEMGTGKTITSIAVAGALYQTGKIHRILVVAPLSILGVWREEFEKFADFDYSLAVLEGSAAKKIDTVVVNKKVPKMSEKNPHFFFNNHWENPSPDGESSQYFNIANCVAVF